jgi:GNAT superfamily N-acetyltransferase
MALLKRAGLFNSLPDGIEIHRATTLEDLRDAYTLVHEIFLSENYIGAYPGGLRVRPYEAMPSTATFVAKVDGKVVGVQSLAADVADLGVPSDRAFLVELEAAREGGRVLCEAANEAVDPEYRKSAVPTDLMRCCFAHALAAGATDLITAISPGHARFYEFLGFEKFTPIRSFSERLTDPVVLVKIDLTSLKARFLDVVADAEGDDPEAFLKAYYFESNPYCDHVERWTRESGKLFSDPEPLKVLFSDLSRLLSRCNTEQADVLEREWGVDVFNAVMDARRPPQRERHALQRTPHERKSDHQREARRLALLKHEGLFGELPGDVQVARASNADDLRGAYGLVHEIFLEQGFIRSFPGDLRVRPFEAMPSTATFIAKRNGRILGAQSLIGDTAIGLPCDRAFEDELDDLRDEGRTVCEAAAEAIAADGCRGTVATELMRCCFAQALAAGATDLITAIPPQRLGFYEFLGFEEFSEVRRYSEKLNRPVLLARIDLAGLDGRFAQIEEDDEGEAFLKRYYIEDNPYRDQVDDWAIEAERMFADTGALKALFLDASRLLTRLNLQESEAVRGQWGQEVFETIKVPAKGTS